MSLKEYLKKIVEIENDAEFCDAEHNTIHEYCDSHFVSYDDIQEIKRRGLDPETYINPELSKLDDRKNERKCILETCRKHLKEFRNMSDIEIFNWICDNFCTTDFEVARQCSFIIWDESH